MLRFSLDCLDLEASQQARHHATRETEKRRTVSNSLEIDKGNELTARDSQYVTSGLFSPPGQQLQPALGGSSWQGAPHNRLSGVDSWGPTEGGEPAGVGVS